MSKRIAVGGFVGLALVLLVFVAVQPVSAAWTKIAPIHVNNTGGNAQAYYPVRLLVPYDSDMNNNFSDIRVVENETYNFIPYWIENKSDGEWCVLWFNATYIPANSWCNDTYYLLYGNSSASDASDGNATFEFFDDFDYTNIPSYLIHNGTHDWAVGGIELPNGDIIAAWEYSSEGEMSNLNYILASRSNDGGITWGSSYTLQDTANRRDVEPQFLVLNNTVYFFYGAIDEDDPNRAGAIYYKTSVDNGTTWSEPHLIESSSHHIATISNPIKLENGDYAGRIILPAQEWDGSQWHSYVYYSDDNCSTWNKSNTVPTSKNLNEPTVVELSDGSLYMLMRNSDSPGGLWQYESKSTDGGVTWSNATSSGIQSPRAQSKLLKLSNGHIILLWNNVSSSENLPRVPLSVAVSTDDCDTWSDAVDIRSGSGIYSNFGLLQKSNGEIIALYPDEINYDIYAAIFTEEVFNNIFLEKWKTVGSPNKSFNNSVLSLICENGDYIESKTFNVSPPVILEVKSRDKDYQTANFPATYGFGWYNGTTYDTNGVLKNIHTAEQYDLLVCDNSGRDYTTGFPRNTNFATYKIVWTSSICHIYENNVQKDSDDVTTHIPTAALPIVIGRTYGGTDASSFDVDWVFVRKYTDPEPTALLGAEQSIGGGECTSPTITNLTNSTPTTNSVTITWTTNQSADNRVKYSKNSDLSNPLWSSWDNDTTSVSIILTGLEANTTYYYQAWSYNGTNSSCFTVEPSSQPYRSFTTQSSGGQYTITLAKGYNMIGWTSTTPKTSSELCNIVPNCSYVYKKNPDSSWTMKQCGYPGGDFSVSRGFGFLAYITQECDWTRDE